MKKIFKFFPVALAAVALASCSSDDLLGVNGEEGQLDPNYLYVSIENDDPITRAAYVSANVQEKMQANGNDFFRTLNWVSGDQIKLYSEKYNWRTQKWEFDETLTGALPQYAKARGFSVFKKAVKVAEHDGEQDEQYIDGYGVMPADLSEFTNEDRTELKFNLNGLKYIQFSQTELDKATEQAKTDATDAGKLYYDNNALHVWKSTAVLPLWGVATSGQMKCKWLTGHLCVDIVNSADNVITAAGAGQNNYLVIQSTGKKLVGEFSAVGFDPDDIAKAPVLTTQAVAATTITSGVTKISDLGEDCIVLNLGADAMKRVIAYVPIMCDAATPTTVTARLYTGAEATDVASAQDVVLTTKDFNMTEPMPTLNEEAIEAGTLYRLTNQEDAATIETANTPWSLQKQLADIDAQMERDYVVTIKNDVLVKTSNTKFEDMATSVADPHNYVLDLSDVAFKHNVTVQFEGTHGFTNNEVGSGDINYLYIKTKAGKKVTFILNDAPHNIKNIVVDDKLGGELILKGDALSATNPVNVINYGTAAANGNLTVAAPTTNIYTSGAMNIDAADATFTNLYVMNNSYSGEGTANPYQVELLNGDVTTLAIAQTTEVSGKTALLSNNVTIHSTGKSSIKNVPAPETKADEGDANTQGITYYTHSSTYYPQYGIYYTSTWDGSKYADEASSNITGGKIYTAAQLASIDGTTSASYSLMTKKMDLNQQEWTPVSLTKAFAGVDVEGAVYSSSTKNTTTYPEIQNLKISQTKAAATGTGFFSKSTANISNLIFSGAAITATNTGSTNFENIGVVAGLVNTSSAEVTLENILVKNSSVNTANGPMNGGQYDAIGGVVGFAQTGTNPINLKNVDIDNVTITGYKYLGGLIGRLSDKGNIGEAYNNADSKCDVRDLTFTIVERATPYVYDFAFKTLGAYIGYAGTNTAANLKVVYDADAMPTFTTSGDTEVSYNKPAKLFDLGKWGILEGTVTNYYDIKFPQTMLGFSAFDVATSVYAERKATFIKYSNTSNSAVKTSSLGTPANTTWNDGTTMYYIEK